MPTEEITRKRPQLSYPAQRERVMSDLMVDVKNNVMSYLTFVMVNEYEDLSETLNICVKLDRISKVILP